MPEQLYTEIKGIYVFAKAKDYLGNWHYLVAENEEQIEKHCKEYSPRGMYPHESNGLAIDQWINYVDPIQVCFFFTWVGERHNPFVVAKPFKYKGATGGIKWSWEADRKKRDRKARLVGPSMKTALVEEAKEIAKKELDKHKV